MGTRVLSRPTEVEAVVSTADCYASEVMGMLALVEGDELHQALSGAFLMFLSDVAKVVPNE